MSVDWMARAWRTQVGSPTRKAVLVALADRCDQDGFCWPSYRDLVERTELSRSTVMRALEELELDEFLERSTRMRANGSKTSNSYQLRNLGDLGGGVTATPPRSHLDTGSGVRVTPPEPSVEPSAEASTTRGAARRRGTPDSRPKSRRLVQPDDDTGSDESPALGASPRASRAERDDRSAARGMSGYGLAIRLERGLKGRTGSAAIVDKAALASQLKRKVDAGTHTYDQLRACIEVFVGAPDRYTSGDMKGWTQFLAALPKLEKDAGNIHRATAPAAEVYGGLDPYEGLR